MYATRHVTRRRRGPASRMTQQGQAAATGDGLFTFSRSGVAYDIMGASYASGVPRFDFGPGQEAGWMFSLRSEELGNVYWTATNLSVSTNNAIGPDGNTSADLLTDNTTNGAHSLSRASVGVVGVRTVYAVYLKMNTQRYVALTNGGSGEFAVFDLQAGTVVVGGSATSARIEAVSFYPGWYHCTLYDATPTTADIILQFTDNASTVVNYAGTGTSVWAFGLGLSTNFVNGVRYVQSVASVAYLSTTASQRGILIEGALTIANGNPQTLGSWTLGGTTSSNNSQVPMADGTGSVADRMVETATTARHIASTAATGLSGAAGTISVYAQRRLEAGRRWLVLSTSTTFATDKAFFDLLNGVVGTVSGGTARITAVGGGWYRCEFTLTSGGASTMVMGLATADNATGTYLGSTSESHYVVNMQAEVSGMGAYGATRPAPTARSAESLSFPTQDIVNCRQGTIVCRIRTGPVDTSGNMVILDLGGTGVSGFWFGLKAGKLTLNVGDGSALNACQGTTTLVANTEYVVGCTWAANGLRVALNGLVETTTTDNGSLFVPASSGYVGSSAVPDNHLNGSIADLMITDEAATLSDLCTLTKGGPIPRLCSATLYAPFNGNLSSFRRY